MQTYRPLVRRIKNGRGDEAKKVIVVVLFPRKECGAPIVMRVKIQMGNKGAPRGEQGRGERMARV